MQVPSKLWEEPDDVSSRLAGLGLTLPGMQDAVAAYRMGLFAATANDPPNAAGSMGYIFATRFLRESLIPQGWRKDDSGGYCRVVHDGARLAIAVSTGDELTGKVIGDEEPRTKRSKGPRTAAAVADNVVQLSLFDPPEIAPQVPRAAASDSLDMTEPPVPNAPDGLVTWILLVHAAGAEICSELSLPVELDDTARIGHWRERIILPPTPLDGPPLLSLDLPPEPGPDFDVTVTRRVG